MVDTTKYKSVAVRIPYYDALVKMGLSTLRGPGQQMMVLIKNEADERGIKIKDEEHERVYSDHKCKPHWCGDCRYLTKYEITCLPVVLVVVGFCFLGCAA